MTGSMDLTPTPMSERPRSWRKWSKICTGILGYGNPRISSGSGSRTSKSGSTSSTEGSGECCKKVSSCAVFLFFILIMFVLLHVLFFILLYSLKWQLSCSWAHCSFV
ncbi:hypothetical protein AB205_0044480 [Aquarana catesbeiana]|uniref:Uncharacterized protein n=1 Tax=Aquarana catesbeiana TaxID=8400 RepID=A0A2G9NW98_AQUCT|nr:hypothetical protein AB205_0044480 [Aquarana catesbeiana]